MPTIQKGATLQNIQTIANRKFNSSFVEDLDRHFFGEEIKIIINL